MGSGNSQFAVDQIIKMARENYKEASQLAQKLKRDTLKNTLAAIHSFVWNNFNNINEGREHTLQTLSAAYYGFREKGINCEDATIITLQILSNLGIKAYVRKIWQPASPENPTHVYVVVPLNQENPSAKSRQLYYVIDGTLPTPNQEAAFVKFKDVMAEPKIKYYGMNGACCSGRKHGMNEPITVTIMAIAGAMTALKEAGVGFHNEETQIKNRVAQMIADNVLWLKSTQGEVRKGAGYINQFSKDQLQEFITRVNQFIALQKQNMSSFPDCENGSPFKQGSNDCGMWRVHRREISAAEVLKVLASQRLQKLGAPTTDQQSSNNPTKAGFGSVGNLLTLSLIGSGLYMALKPSSNQVKASNG